ncbi:Lipopolysaccharide biosynthesis chain length determinant protein [Janthinobacterium sp. CG23_2]|nr:Lipopolysaccharide biosynthesis chain length determinant protein [Janthinobacterium sp. CG23_2]CUU26540.1 Lipopolysaccharide biosynthesis chain length determinant protein [Janthinobacterium sp. CG23_2]
MEDFISQMLLHARGIWKYRWLAVGLMWVVACAGWLVVLRLPNNYQSSARVFVDTQSILKPLMAGMTSIPNVQQQVSIMSRTLLSRPNLERVLRMVDLDVNATTPRQRESQIDELAARLKITDTSTNDIYSITYAGDNPKHVHDVVQALLTIFLEGSFKGKKGDSQQAIRFIDEQIKNYERRLVAAENTVKEFKLRNSALLPRQGVDYGAQLAIASDALSTARIDLLEAEQARLAIQARINGDPQPAGSGSRARTIVNPDIDARIAAINKNLDTLRLQYTDLHPDVIAARRLLAQLEARKIEESKHAERDGDPGRYYSPMLQQLKVALTEADAKVAAMRVRVHEYTVRQERLQEQSNAVPEVESQLAQLNRDYDINKDNYEKLIARRESAKLSGDLSSSTEMMTFRIIDPPIMPVAPSGPNRRLFYSGVLAIALCAGLGAAVLVSQVRPTFVSPSALREITGLNVIGTVSMSWTDTERRKLRRGQYLLGLAFGALLGAYGAVMASGFFTA